jgi:hypothetical protein
MAKGRSVYYLVVRDTKLLSATDELPDFLDEGADGMRACQHLGVQFNV